MAFGEDVDEDDKRITIPKIKLTDFGYATHLPHGHTLTDGVGSRYYMAPEVIQ